MLSYLPPVADLDGWLGFIDRALDRYGHLVRYLQVTLEANFPIPRIDGSSPGVVAALTQGLPHARTRVRDGVQVGFSLAEPAEWLGGAHRTPAGQVSSLTALIDASAAAGARQFDLFALSDADSDADSPLGTFGLCTGDYIPKPAYETYRSRIKPKDQ